VFRRVLGVTPAAWRQINATGPGQRSDSRPPISVCSRSSSGTRRLSAAY
jgi:hypothetical protein